VLKILPEDKGVQLRLLGHGLTLTVTEKFDFHGLTVFNLRVCLFTSHDSETVFGRKPQLDKHQLVSVTSLLAHRMTGSASTALALSKSPLY